MKTMIFSSFLCIVPNINREKCILFDILNNGKRQNDVERCNTTCSREVELPCIERQINVQISGFFRLRCLLRQYTWHINLTSIGQTKKKIGAAARKGKI